MKRILLSFLLVLLVYPLAHSSEKALFLNAFGETATAYLNDGFLLLGATADGYVADIMDKKTAVEIAANVQKRVRVIRAKLEAVSKCNIAQIDKQLLDLLNSAYACLDRQAWALTQYLEDKSPSTAKRFEEQRLKCLEGLRKVSEFYSTLPPSPELPAPLGTR
jgi:hypothetical protein